MPSRPKQQWDMGVNTAKVCHLCCGIIMEGNIRKTTKSFNLFRTVMSSNNNVYRYAKIDLLSLTSCNPYLSLTKAANKIKRMSYKHETGKLRSNYELSVYMLSTK